MLKEKTMKDVGEAEAEIFEAHQMLLEDLDFVEGITGMIENDKVNAEYAVFVTGEQCAALFLSMDDDFPETSAKTDPVSTTTSISATLPARATFPRKNMEKILPKSWTF